MFRVFVHIFGILAVFSYAYSFWAYGSSSRRKREDLLERAEVWLRFGALFAALSLLSLFLAGLSRIASRGDYALLLCLLVSCAYIFRRREASPILGAGASGLSLFLLLLSSVLLHFPKAIPGFGRVDALTFALHILPAWIAELSLLLAFVVSTALLVHERRLKSKKLAVFDLGGPSLEKLDSLNRTLVVVGFIAISVAAASGFLGDATARRVVPLNDPLVVSAMLSWVFLAVINVCRFALHWSPKRLSKVTVLLSVFFFGMLIYISATSGDSMHVTFKI